MPWAPARRCTRCRASFTGTRCPTCHPSWANRPSSWPGGSTRRWRNVRSAQLVEHPLCAFCGALADTVDHIDGTDYATQRYDPTMVRSLCTDCHDERTRQQSADARSTKE